MTCPLPTYSLDNAESRKQTESSLFSGTIDFQAAYMAVKNLNFHIQSAPQHITPQTVGALMQVMTSGQFDSQRQVLFLYRETSEALLNILFNWDNDAAKTIIQSLKSLLASSTGQKHRATAEALASLPVSLAGLLQPLEPDTGHAEIDFFSLTSILDIQAPVAMSWKGRSLTGKTGNGRIGVIKFIKTGEDPCAMTLETLWMDAFSSMEFPEQARFDIPVPARIGQQYLLKITDLPDTVTRRNDLHPDGFAIAFSAADDYFRYPNGDSTLPGIPETEFLSVMSRNAWLLGKTASMGLIHTAPIPLFHNRVQQNRREDSGIYEWQRGGRLDQWLESCRHPNFSSSGLRDFEHFVSLRSTRNLIGYLGSHLLSIVLVTGSYFRNKDPEKKGFDPQGNPIDARGLFDRDLFRTILVDCVRSHYHGFTGTNPEPGYPGLPDSLVDELIQEMGMDTHMEEVLRIEDQIAMSRHQFEAFLLERGFSREEVALIHRGDTELRIMTGPHLGGFNQRISVPDIIDFIFSCSALCIAGRYLSQNGLNQQPK